MLFTAVGRFRSDASQERMSLREAFSDHLASHAPRIHLGGPLMDEQGKVKAVFLILEAPDRAAVEAFLAESPYQRAGLYETLEIDALNLEVGRLI